MSELTPNFYYVDWDNIVYGFKYNFQITTIWPSNAGRSGNVQTFDTKEEAVHYINSVTDHQIKVLNMISKYIPKAVYQE